MDVETPELDLSAGKGCEVKSLTGTTYNLIVHFFYHFLLTLIYKEKRSQYLL